MDNTVAYVEHLNVSAVLVQVRLHRVQSALGGFAIVDPDAVRLEEPVDRRVLLSQARCLVTQGVTQLEDS